MKINAVKIIENLETTSPNCWRIVAGQPHWPKVMRNSSLKPPRPRFKGRIMFSKPVSQLPFLPMFQNVPDHRLFCHIALFVGCSEVCHTIIVRACSRSIVPIPALISYNLWWVTPKNIKFHLLGFQLRSQTTWKSKSSFKRGSKVFPALRPNPSFHPAGGACSHTCSHEMDHWSHKTKGRCEVVLAGS